MSSWNGTRVRKGKMLGTVIGDANGYARVLTVKMDDGTFGCITMNNMGDDPKEVHEWEWFITGWPNSCVNDTWARF